MVSPPYMISSVMLEEHRRNVERRTTNPDGPDAPPVARPMQFAGTRHRLSALLFALAERLQPADDGKRRPDAWASEPT